MQRYTNNESEIYDLFARLFKLTRLVKSIDMGKQIANRFPNMQTVLKLHKSGYLDDPNNTDNSWKEADVYSIHLIGDIQNVTFDAEEIPQYQWCEISELSKYNLSQVHSQLLQKASSQIAN